MRKYETQQIQEWANYIIANRCSTNAAAKHFGVAQKTLYYNMVQLKETNAELAEVLENNRRNKAPTASENAVVEPTAEITVHNPTTVTASGARRTGNCHPVICIDTGAIYSSSYDAAEAIGATQSMLSHVLTGRCERTKGLRFCKVSEASAHIGDIAKVIIDKTAKNAELTEQSTDVTAKYNALLEKERARETAKQKLAELTEKRARLLAELQEVETSIEETKNKLLEV